MTKTERALEYFANKFFCSQAVLAAYADEFGLTEAQALKLGACFNSGMRKGEVCGACSGALMVLGLKHGQADIDDVDGRAKANQATAAFLDRFAEENGSYICNTLLGCDISTKEGVQYAVEQRLFADFCPKMVASAVDILEELM